MKDDPSPPHENMPRKWPTGPATHIRKDQISSRLQKRVESGPSKKHRKTTTTTTTTQQKEHHQPGINVLPSLPGRSTKSRQTNAQPTPFPLVCSMCIIHDHSKRLCFFPRSTDVKMEGNFSDAHAEAIKLKEFAFSKGSSPGVLRRQAIKT